MTRLRIAAASALFGVLAGCAPPAILPEPSHTAAVPTRSTGTLPAQAEVDAALLAPDQLPQGPYHVSDQKPGDAAGLNTSLVQCADSTPNPDPQVAAVRVFQGPSFIGPFVAETITVTSLAETKQLINDLDRVQANCAQFGGQAPGGVDVTVNITPLTMQQFGDATKAFRLTASVPNAGVLVYAHLVVVRAGNVLIQLALMAATSPTIEDTRALVELSVAKAAALRSA